MKRHPSGAALFLLELIIALLFFSLAGAVGLQMFVKASSLSSSTVNSNKAVLLAQQTAEEFYAFEGSGNSKDYYDADWKKLPDSDGAVFECTASTEIVSGSDVASGNDVACSIRVSAVGGQDIYTLFVLRHERRSVL